MSKYRAQKITIDGITFASKAEGQYYTQLKLLQRAGEVKEFKLQPRYKLLPTFRKNGKTIRGIDYVADFLVTYRDGHQELIDVKGMRTPVYTMKKKMMEYQYPDLTIKEVQAR